MVALLRRLESLIVAGNPVIAHDKFFSDDEIVALKERGLSPLLLINSKRWSDGAILVVLDSSELYVLVVYSRWSSEPSKIHFMVGSFFAVVTGVVPCLLINISNRG